MTDSEKPHVVCSGCGFALPSSTPTNVQGPAFCSTACETIDKELLRTRRKRIAHWDSFRRWHRKLDAALWALQAGTELDYESFAHTLRKAHRLDRSRLRAAHELTGLRALGRDLASARKRIHEAIIRSRLVKLARAHQLADFIEKTLNETANGLAMQADAVGARLVPRTGRDSEWGPRVLRTIQAIEKRAEDQFRTQGARRAGALQYVTLLARYCGLLTPQRHAHEVVRQRLNRWVASRAEKANS